MNRVTTHVNPLPLRVIGWTKSSRSEQGWFCVEIASDGQAVFVRDSKDPHGPVLSFSGETWRDFVSDLRSGAFDLN